MTEPQHLHHFVDGVCLDPRAVPAPCGERQVYRPPTGQRATLPDVLIDKADLRDLIGRYRDQCAMPDSGGDALCDRLELLLD
jgi:hypothetical protein